MDGCNNDDEVYKRNGKNFLLLLIETERAFEREGKKRMLERKEMKLTKRKKKK